MDIEDPTPPSPPVWVEKSLAEEWPERGIDAHESGGIFLEWSTEANEDINAIAIFRCEISQTSNIFSEYSLVAKINKESGQVSKYIDNLWHYHLSQNTLPDKVQNLLQ